MAKKKQVVSKAKAKKILTDGTVKGHKLTKKQQRFFGWQAGGAKPRRKGRRKS